MTDTRTGWTCVLHGGDYPRRGQCPTCRRELASNAAMRVAKEIAKGKPPSQVVADEVARVVGGGDEYQEGVEALREMSRALTVMSRGLTSTDDRELLQMMAGNLRGLALRFERHRPDRKAS
jgi:hypothetical protein